MATVRFQADADLRQAIVSGVLRRQPELDIQSANAAGLEGKTDQEVLAIAAQENRVLVSPDRRTMPTEFGIFTTTRTSAGLLIISQNTPANEAIDAIILV